MTVECPQRRWWAESGCGRVARISFEFPRSTKLDTVVVPRRSCRRDPATTPSLLFKTCP